MSEDFFNDPILNSPYEYPSRHWILDSEGQPTGAIEESRRKSELITPVPKPKKRSSKSSKQIEIVLGGEEDLSTEAQEYNPTPIINEIRQYVNQWRKFTDKSQLMVTPETERLLNHWRNPENEGVRPFFCQIEAVETIIWLTEVAPKMGKSTKKFLDHIKGANAQANPELVRLAIKLATGTGKTTVMAMLISWQTVNAVRYPKRNEFSTGFLIVTPGITIKDRLRVLYPSDSENYYRKYNILPQDMYSDLKKARIVITNFHAFKKREKYQISSGTKKLISGWRKEKVLTEETDNQMLQRVARELIGLKNIVVINDEAHHCYREKVGNSDTESVDDLKGDEKAEAKKSVEAARIWISGLETVKRELGVLTVYDLSATPFFLSGSGYIEGTLFPWTISDFSLVDAIESGIVKFPRVPITDNTVNEEKPIFRNLWDHIGKHLSKKPKSSETELDPLGLPLELITALDSLYGHYEKTFEIWQDANSVVPPVFIVVCNNTTTSELVYKYISGFVRENKGEQKSVVNGRLKLFQNYNEVGVPLARPNTILIDSAQLESGEALDSKFRNMASEEIEQFKNEIIKRTGDRRAGDNIDDATLLREVMNTVGREGKLGEQIRCVVSVSMLTEGWDATTVTHILGVRAFGTQLICEQVVGRGLRRQSYELNEKNKFDVEYADILGIPFDFTSKPVVAPPKPPKNSVHVHAVIPDRNELEITYPRVEGYRTELPSQLLQADFKDNHVLELTPELVGPSITENRALIGESATLNLEHLDNIRENTLIYNLTTHLLYLKFRDRGDEPKITLFGQLKRIVKQWFDSGCLKCSNQTYPGMLMYKILADMACERIKSAITESSKNRELVQAILDPYNPSGSTSQVNFHSSNERRWQTDAQFCHVNWAVCDSDWELEFCRMIELTPNVISYVKNQGLGFEVPYRMKDKARKYVPDFIVKIDAGNGNCINVIVEIKGYRGEDAKVKSNTITSYWIPGVNNLKKFGYWTFIELTSVQNMQHEFDKFIEQQISGS